MKRTSFSLVPKLVVMLLGLATLLPGQFLFNFDLTRFASITTTTVASLPASNNWNGRLIWVSDSADGTCTTGGGSGNVVCKWNGSAWVSSTPTGVFAAVSHSHATTDVTSGTFADARISESSVLQHEAAFTLANLLGDLALGTKTSGNYVQNVLCGGTITGCVTAAEGTTPTLNVDIASQTEIVSPASNDWLLVELNAGGTYRKIQYSNVSSGSGLTDGDKGDITVASSGTVWTIDTAAVSADELDEAGVRDALEAVMQLQDMQGAVTDGQVPDTITITSIGQAGNVDLTGLADGNCLVYDGVTDNRFEPGACGAGSGNMSQSAENTTDNRLPRTVGTSGRTFEETNVEVDDNDKVIAPGGFEGGDGTVAAGLVLKELAANGTNDFRIYGAENQASDGCIVVSGPVADDQILKGTASTATIDGKTCRVMAAEADDTGAATTETVVIQVLGPTTEAAVGDGKQYFPIPAAINGWTLSDVEAHVVSVGTTNTLDIQLARCDVVATGNTCSGTVVDMLSTKLTIDSNESKTATAATAAVINAANDDVDTDEVIRVDIDAIHTTPSDGLVLVLEFTAP